MTDYLTVVGVLAIHGMQIIADASETYAFISDRLETGRFEFPVLVRSLRANTTA